jgi:hypothetical protein
MTELNTTQARDNESGGQKSKKGSSTSLFLRGVILRLVYGLFGVVVGVYFIPGIYSRKEILVPTLVFYSFICILGGINDAKRGVRLPLWGSGFSRRP